MPISSRLVVRSTILLLGVGFFTLVGIVLATIWLGERAHYSFNEVIEARETRSAAVELRAALQTAESSQRGFIITGNEIYLAPYDNAKTQSLRRLEILKRRLAGDAQSAKLVARVRRLDDEVHPACGVLTFASTAVQRRARLESQGETLASFLAKIPDPARRQRQEEVLTLGTAAPSALQALRIFERLLEDMGKALSAGEWLVGGACTLADMSYVPYVLRVHNLGLEQTLRVSEPVTRWFRALQERPSYAAAIAAWSDAAQEAAMRKTSAEAWKVG